MSVKLDLTFPHRLLGNLKHSTATGLQGRLIPTWHSGDTVEIPGWYQRDTQAQKKFDVGNLSGLLRLPDICKTETYRQQTQKVSPQPRRWLIYFFSWACFQNLYINFVWHVCNAPTAADISNTVFANTIYNLDPNIDSPPSLWSLASFQLLRRDCSTNSDGDNTPG